MSRRSITTVAAVIAVLLAAPRVVAQQNSTGWGSGPAAVRTVGWGTATAKAPDKATAKPAAARVTSAAPTPMPANAPAKPAAPPVKAAEAKPKAVTESIALRWPTESLTTAPPAAHDTAARTVLLWPIPSPGAEPPVQALTAPPTPTAPPAPAAPIDTAPPAPSPAPAPRQVEQAPTPRPVATAAPKPTAISHRWLDAQTLNLATRYRYVDTSVGVVTANQLQHSETVKVRFTFDKAGRYAVVAGLGTGTSFTGGWNNAGVGTPNDLLWTLSLKQLYVSATPWKGLEAQYGGLYFVRGEGTEITTYDNDAYLAGERVTVKRPDLFLLDEVSATTGYLGDLSTLNFLRRYERLSESNYYQVLVGKKLGKAVGASADVTSVSGVRTGRSAFSVKAPKTLGVDLLRVEAYHRFGKAATGYAVSAEKSFVKKLTLGVGTADIDMAYGGLNADRFNKGQRWFLNGSLTIVPELSVLTFYQHAFGNDVAVSNRSRLDVILQFNALKALQRAHWY